MVVFTVQNAAISNKYRRLQLVAPSLSSAEMSKASPIRATLPRDDTGLRSVHAAKAGRGLYTEYEHESCPIRILHVRCQLLFGPPKKLRYCMIFVLFGRLQRSVSARVADRDVSTCLK